MISQGLSFASTWSKKVVSKSSSLVNDLSSTVLHGSNTSTPAKLSHYADEVVVLQVPHGCLINCVAELAFLDGTTAATMDQRTVVPDHCKARGYTSGSYELWRYPGMYLRRPVVVHRIVFVFAPSDCPRRKRSVGGISVPYSETVLPSVELGRFLSDRVAMSALTQLVGTGGYGCWAGAVFPCQEVLDRFVRENPSRAKLDPAPMRLSPGDHIFAVRWILDSHVLYIQHHGVYDEDLPSQGPPSVIHFFSAGAGDTLGLVFERLLKAHKPTVAKIMQSSITEFKDKSIAIFRWDADKELQGEAKPPAEIIRVAREALAPNDKRIPVVYDPISFNCEHAATLFCCGIAYCHQTDKANPQEFYHQRLL
jgi:hypothetical protein